MYDVGAQAASLQRVANSPADYSKTLDQRRLATGAQDSILPHYGETE